MPESKTKAELAAEKAAKAEANRKKKQKQKEKKKATEGGAEDVEAGENENDSAGAVPAAPAAPEQTETAEKNEQKPAAVAVPTKSKEGSTSEEPKPDAGAKNDDGENDDGGDDDEGGMEGLTEEEKKRRKKEKEKEKKAKKKARDAEKAKEEKAKKKGGPGAAQVKMMKEALEKKREEEEAARLAAEEEERRIERLENERVAKALAEAEKKRLKKEKEKARIAKLKAEGKFLTPKQKADMERARQMLQQAGVVVGPRPDGGDEAAAEKKKKPIYTNKKKQQQLPRQSESVDSAGSGSGTPREEKSVPPSAEEPAAAVAAVADGKPVEEETEEDLDWEKIGDDDEKEGEGSGEDDSDSDDDSDEDDDSDSDDDDDDDAEEESTSSEVPATKGGKSGQLTKEELKERVRARIDQRKAEANKKRSTKDLRAPVICVLGHVDTGKTSLLDKLRRTNVQGGEAGGITQQIGATNVPLEVIQEKTKMVQQFDGQKLTIPGFLIIDTPGHESFSNLRSRGSSLCDIAILVVDIMHGIEPQTIESIKLLLKRKTPFVVALNKIDRLNHWKNNPDMDVRKLIESQNQNARKHFDEQTRLAIQHFAEQGLNAALYWENYDTSEYISMIPTSAHTGEGMGNLMAYVASYAQKDIPKKLSWSSELECTVMEVKEIKGLGTTIDVILVNGQLNYNDRIICAGSEGPIVTNIRDLMMPEPLKEIRVKTNYDHFKSIKAAQGVKIAAKELEKALAGLPLLVAQTEDEVEVCRDDMTRYLSETLSSIKLSSVGVYVQASTLGSLEALLAFLKAQKIKYCGINIGPVHKKDVMKASTMLEQDEQYAVILAFDVKVEREAQTVADEMGIRIFTADIIYHLEDAFLKYREELKEKEKAKHAHKVVYPAKLKCLPQYVFNKRDPIIMGVRVEAGVLRVGTPILALNDEKPYLGQISSVEINNKPVEPGTDLKGQEVCIKIENTTGDAPKMFGRHFNENDLLVSRISRDSIDICKEYFRDEFTKADWQLVIELKKHLGIM